MLPTIPECGVYRITNLKDGRVYIGRTISFYERKLQHFSELRAGCHHNSRLQESFNTDGEDSFEFLPIVSCDSSSYAEIEKLLIREHGSEEESRGFNLRPGSCSGARRLVVLRTTGSEPRTKSDRRGRYVIQTRFNRYEILRVEKAAKNDGRSLAEFVRRAVLASLKSEA